MTRQVLVFLLLSALNFRVCAVDVGQPMPTCPALLEASVAKTLTGKVVIVDFWASWCPPCRKLMPFLDELQTAHRAQGLVVVAINVDEAREDATRFVQRMPVSYAIVYDPAGACPARFALQGMPATFLIDRQGIVRQVHTGFRGADRNSLRAALNPLIN